MYKLSFLILIYLVLTSCEKEVHWVFEPNNKQIVVDGIITNKKKSHIIRITKSVTELNEVPEPVNGARVTVDNGDTLILLTEFPKNSGIYRTNSNYRAFINKSYTLRIYYNAEWYSSVETNIIKVSSFDRLTYSYNTHNNLYYIDSIAKSFSSKESAMYEVIIDWTHLPAYKNVAFLEKRATLYFYTLKTIDISQVFAPEKETVYFPLGARILERKYSLAPQHAEYIRSMLSETDWRGGFFDLTQANVSTNMRNGALGFFGICTVLRDTLVVE